MAPRHAVQQSTAVLHFNPTQTPSDSHCCSCPPPPPPRLPLSLLLVDYRQKISCATAWSSSAMAKHPSSPLRLLLLYSPPSFPPLKPFTPLHYTNKANHPSGWCSHGPGRTCQQGEINGLHQRAGAAHKPPQHRAREIRLLLPYIFHEIIHYSSVLACGLSAGCF